MATPGHRTLSQLQHPKNEVAIETDLTGQALLNYPLLNKGSAFTREERKEFDLEGLLPYEVDNLDDQCARAYEQFKSRTSDILRYTFVRSLADQNKVLFYNFVLRHLKECIPIIYTPTAGEASQQYSQLFRRPDQGLFLSYPTRDTMEQQIMQHGKNEDIDLIVVTDGEAILGIGDWGVGGMTISTAKANIYTLGGGIDPTRILPVVLDVGTDRESLLNDPLYLGWKHKRLTGKEYDEFSNMFCEIVRKKFPDSLLHFEDFGTSNAQRLLDVHRPLQSCFNDDIQGTAAVVLGALISACKVNDTKLSDHRIAVFGFGSAGVGITTEIHKYLTKSLGLTSEEAASHFYPIDRYGLVLSSQSDLRPGQKLFAVPDSTVSDWKRTGSDGTQISLSDVVREAKPTILIGTSGQSHAFDESVIREMAKHCDRPIVFPLSNPTKLCECDPADANEWTGGKGLFATGSPFPPVDNPDGSKKVIGQANNALIYPGLALGTIVSRATHLSDRMILAGTSALAALSPALQDPNAPLLPDLSEMRFVSLKVALAVANAARGEGLVGKRAEEERGHDGEFTEEEVRGRVYDPIYRPLEKIQHGGQTFLQWFNVR